MLFFISVEFFRCVHVFYFRLSFKTLCLNFTAIKHDSSERIGFLKFCDSQQKLESNVEIMKHKLALWSNSCEDAESAENVFADFQVSLLLLLFVSYNSKCTSVYVWL